MTHSFSIAERFRSFLPVVVDVETGGFNCRTDALLEIAAVLLDPQDDGTLMRGETIRYHVKPFEGKHEFGGRKVPAGARGRVRRAGKSAHHASDRGAKQRGGERTAWGRGRCRDHVAAHPADAAHRAGRQGARQGQRGVEGRRNLVEI